MSALLTDLSPRPASFASRRQRVLELRARIRELAARHGASAISVFGSVARGEDAPQSDIDFLVKFPAGATLQGVVELAESLEQLLGCKVDLVSEHAGLKPRFLEAIKDELLSL